MGYCLGGCGRMLYGTGFCIHCVQLQNALDALETGRELVETCDSRPKGVKPAPVGQWQVKQGNFCYTAMFSIIALSVCFFPVMLLYLFALDNLALYIIGAICCVVLMSGSCIVFYWYYYRVLISSGTPSVGEERQCMFKYYYYEIDTKDNNWLKATFLNRVARARYPSKLELIRWGTYVVIGGLIFCGLLFGIFTSWVSGGDTTYYA